MYFFPKNHPSFTCQGDIFKVVCGHSGCCDVISLASASASPVRPSRRSLTDVSLARPLRCSEHPGRTCSVTPGHPRLTGSAVAYSSAPLSPTLFPVLHQKPPHRRAAPLRRVRRRARSSTCPSVPGRAAVTVPARRREPGEGRAAAGRRTRMRRPLPPPPHRPLISTRSPAAVPPARPRRSSPAPRTSAGRSSSPKGPQSRSRDSAPSLSTSGVRRRRRRGKTLTPGDTACSPAPPPPVRPVPRPSAGPEVGGGVSPTRKAAGAPDLLPSHRPRVSSRASPLRAPPLPARRGRAGTAHMRSRRR